MSETPRPNRAQRARVIRRRVITGALALFISVWLLIAVVMAFGRDPMLGRTGTATAATSSASTGDDGSSGDDGSGAVAAASQSQSAGPVSPVTTQQS